MDRNEGVEITMEGAVAVVGFQATSISNVQGIAEVSEKINSFVDRNHPVKVVFDFSGVKFFSSQVLGVLLSVRSRVKGYDGQVVISGIDPRLHRVFKITNLDKIFSFFPDKDSAVNQVSRD